MVAEGRRCVRCGAVVLEGMLCPLHREEAETFTHHLRQIAKYEMIRTVSLNVDYRFQRPVNETRVRDIVLNFNELDLGTLTVSRRAHEIVILDGQQRWTALVRMGFAEAPCEVLESLTLEQEILTFVIRNEHRTAVRKGILFNDKAKAGVSLYANATTILKSFRYEMVDPGSRTGVAVNRLSCPGTVETVHRMGKLGATLFVIRQAWPDSAEPNRSEMLLGIAAFLQINPHIRPEDLAESLSRFAPAEIIGGAKAVGKVSVERRLWVHVYEQIIQRYNYNRKTHRVSRVEIIPRAPKMWMN